MSAAVLRRLSVALAAVAAVAVVAIFVLLYIVAWQPGSNAREVALALVTLYLAIACGGTSAFMWAVTT